MKFEVGKEKVLEALQAVAGVVERRQTTPVLANLRIEVSEDNLVLTGTDQEVQLTTRLNGLSVEKAGTTTASARKLVDLCRSIPPGGKLSFELEESRLFLSSGRFKSHLSTLPASDFPLVEEENDLTEISLSAEDLKVMLDRTSFAMAQQDVRYFFNGTLFESEEKKLNLVATNSQRLAICSRDLVNSGVGKFIVPRKGVLELAKLVADKEGQVCLRFSANHMSVDFKDASLVTKLIDGTYPDYRKVIPQSGDKVVRGNRQEIREALVRTAILSNEMYRNIKLILAAGQLGIQANNPLHEDAEEEVAVSYEGTDLEIGFNVSYLIDCLSAMEGQDALLTFTDGSSAVLIVDPTDQSTEYVVSPMVI